jgi:hypothetical protein
VVQQVMICWRMTFARTVFIIMGKELKNLVWTVCGVLIGRHGVNNLFGIS